MIGTEPSAPSKITFWAATHYVRGSTPVRVGVAAASWLSLTHSVQSEVLRTALTPSGHRASKTAVGPGRPPRTVRAPSGLRSLDALTIPCTFRRSCVMMGSVQFGAGHHLRSCVAPKGKSVQRRRGPATVGGQTPRSIPLVLTHWEGSEDMATSPDTCVRLFLRLPRGLGGLVRTVSRHMTTFQGARAGLAARVGSAVQGDSPWSPSGSLREAQRAQVRH